MNNFLKSQYQSITLQRILYLEGTSFLQNGRTQMWRDELTPQCQREQELPDQASHGAAQWSRGGISVSDGRYRQYCISVCKPSPWPYTCIYLSLSICRISRGNSDIGYQGLVRLWYKVLWNFLDQRQAFNRQSGLLICSCQSYMFLYSV